MRRRSDDWVNATHILKAAGFDKVFRMRARSPTLRIPANQPANE